MNRFICIHGHFYQPPRENPWLETIELQDSAYPYHDWNERITAECYATNASSRILDEKNRIAQIVNNYTRMSFNFGPTLLSWMEKKVPDVYRSILEADKDSRRAFYGHGSALAQIYNHLIMPLANSRDKKTQVLWGLRDFAFRFQRKAEGLWLPETAVDLETLDILAAQGISFTVLAPHQAKRVRRAGDSNWTDVVGGKIDPRMPYLCHLPSGRTISIFFYDGPISQEIAFGDLLKSGEAFAKRLLGALKEQDARPQLVHIACDGETFGHHHRFGEMALSYALHYIESHGFARITNYGEYLKNHPPDQEVEIIENTSWSCVHGVERWRSDCGCDSGNHPEWHQRWRAPLREALDWLRDVLAPMYEKMAASLMADPWEARDRYIEVILDRRPENIERFFEAQCPQRLRDEEKILVLKLMELQRHAVLMYTSCGWFFDDVSGIETVQILQYAGRVLQLAGQLFGNSLETQFLQRLEAAPSNVPQHANGRLMFERSVRPAMLSLKNVGAHYAISSLFNGSANEKSVFCYAVDREAYNYSEAGKARMSVGRAKFTSNITRGSATLSFTVLYMGEHNVSCGVSEFKGTRLYQTMETEMIGAFREADFPLCLRVLDRHFGTSTYSLKSLFREKRRDILNLILGSTLAEAEASYRQLYEYHAPMMRFLKEMGVPAPKALVSAAEAALNNSLLRAFEKGNFDGEHIANLFSEVKVQGVTLEAESLELALRRAIERLAQRLLDHPSETERLYDLRAALSLLPSIPLKVDLWTVQNLYFKMLKSVYPPFRDIARGGNAQAQAWIAHFAELGKDLYIRVEELEQKTAEQRG